MKRLGFTLAIALLLLSTTIFAQTQSDAEKSFDRLKTLAGSWQGKVTTDPKDHAMGDNAFLQVTLRVTSRGNALMHEMKGEGPDNPITMMYLDQDRLLLTHYCDAGNRPRMTGKLSPDGKTVEFEFLDIAGSTQHGHMQHAVFTFIDANHHTEDWTFIMPGNKTVRAHMDLQRANKQEALSR